MTRLSVSPAILFHRSNNHTTAHAARYLSPPFLRIRGNTRRQSVHILSALPPLPMKCRPPRVMSNRRTKGARGGMQERRGGAGSPTRSGAAGRGAAEISSNFCASSGESRDLLVLACLAPNRVRPTDGVGFGGLDRSRAELWHTACGKWPRGLHMFGTLKVYPVHHCTSGMVTRGLVKDLPKP